MDLIENDIICSICLENFEKVEKDKTIEKDNLFKTDCNHCFHKCCIKKWKSGKRYYNCPNCRKQLVNEEYQNDPNDPIALNYHFLRIMSGMGGLSY